MKKTHLWAKNKWFVIPTLIMFLAASACTPIAAPTAETGLSATGVDTSTLTSTLTSTITNTISGENLPDKGNHSALGNADTNINQAYLQWVESTGVAAAEIAPDVRAASPLITVTLLLEDEAAVNEVKAALEALNGTVLAEAGTTVSVQLPIGELSQLSTIPGVLLIQTPSIAPPVSVAPSQPQGFNAPAELPNDHGQSESQEEISASVASQPIDSSGLEEILASKQSFFALADSTVNIAYQRWKSTVMAAGGDVATAATTSELITVTLVMNDLDAAIAAQAWLPTVGATLIDSYREWLVITIPVGQVQALVTLPGLLLAQQPSMKPPAEPFSTGSTVDAPSNARAQNDQPAAGTIVTEGVARSGIDQWHAAGYTGEGVKIAIVDNFDQAIINNAYNQGELPTNVLNGPSSQGVDHGIAVAEIVYDMAPDSTITLHSIGDSPDYCVTFANTLEGFAQAGNQIISSSTGPTFCTTAGDGSTSPLTNAVERIFDEYDTFYAQAAGNNSQHHYEGTFNGISVQVGNTTLNMHDFAGDETTVNIISAPNSNGVFQPVPLNAGTPVRFYLRWDGGWPRSNQDYDMYLVYNTGSSGWNFLGQNDCPQYACFSAITQDGTAPPIERIEALLPYSGYYGIVLVKYNASGNHYLDLLTGHSQPYLMNHVKTRSLVAAASYPAVYAVAAVDVDSLALESYSSQGPTYGPGNSPNGGFDQPKLSGYANVRTSVQADFNGTSAATPHVAGAAAVVRGVAPCLTAREVGEWLQTQATDLGPTGYDHQYGSGALTFPATSQRPSCGNQGPFPPQAVGNSYTTITNTLVSGNLLNNDSDPQDSQLTVTAFTQPANGTSTVNTNGSFTYNPDTNFVGMDFFTYTIQNSHNLTSTAAVYVLVQADGDEPATVAVYTAGVATTQAISAQPYALSLQLPADLVELGAGQFLAIVHTPIITPTVNMTITDGSFVGIIYELDAYVNGVMRTDIDFSAPLRMEIQYPASTVQGINPNSLGMLYWDEASNSWKSNGIQVASRSPQNRRLTVATHHLTQFGLFSLANPSEYSAIFMPKLSK